MGVKMVLSGEGSDEIFGGYLYFHNAPSADEFHKECVRRVKNLHLSDCLRANKATQVKYIFIIIIIIIIKCQLLIHA